jgi:prolyl oligopeptidase
MRFPALLCAGLAFALAAQAPVKAPPTRKLDVVDHYFGTNIPDPYRWLEDDNSLDTKAWVKAQNEVTDAYLTAITERERIRARMTRLWDYEKYGAPSKHGKYYVYSYNTGLQNQGVVYLTEKLEEKGRVLFDPNALSKDGTVALGGMRFSEDGKFVAYNLSKGGADVSIWKVRDVETGQDLPDAFPPGRMGVGGWTKDGSGFYYTDYPKVESGRALTAVYKNQKLFFHKLGDPREKDAIVYERPDQPDWGFGGGVTDDGAWLVIHQSQGTERKNRLFLKDLRQVGSKVEPLFDKFDGSYSVLGNDGDTFYVLTDFGAPRHRIVAVDRKDPRPEAWKEIIPQGPGRDVLSGASLLGNTFAVTWKVDALNTVKLYDLQGKFQKEIRMEGVGSLGGFGGRREDTEAFYSFTSYNLPATLYRYDLKKGKSSVFRQPKVAFDPADYEVKEVFYQQGRHEDPHVPGLPEGPEAGRPEPDPALRLRRLQHLAASVPRFSPATVVWLEMGGVFAEACLRGAASTAGVVRRGQAATSGRTSSTTSSPPPNGSSPGEVHLHAQAGHPRRQQRRPAGGRLPDPAPRPLRRGAARRGRHGHAALPQVHHRLDVEERLRQQRRPRRASKYLMKYSPLHNIKPGVKYPPTLVTTGDHDDRVVPAHSHKFIATLQADQAGPPPSSPASRPTRATAWASPPPNRPRIHRRAGRCPGPSW